ncbi:MAG: hypothetical protein R3B09_26850 [Nannocystaceae bacterium]
MRGPWGRPTLLLAATALTCTGEVDRLVGVLEPVRVQSATFREGDLPTAAEGPTITSIESASGILLTGQLGRTLGGRAREDAHAVALRLADRGSGWWIVPIQDLDPMFPGERDFQLRYDVGVAPPGPQTLRLAAIDREGRRGPVFDLDVCVRSDAFPDDLNGCDPKLPPPAAVVVLAWDRPVDIDLVVDTPDGERIAWKTPTSAASDGGAVPGEALADPRTGRLTRDSNAGCEIDGRNVEVIVWKEPPIAGPYLVYADLYDPCGEAASLFVATAYRRELRDDGTYRLVELDRSAGALLDLQASGGAGAPLFVMDLDLP